MRSLVTLVIAIILSGSLTSCFDEKKPNYQFMPNMYHSVAYEAYGEYDIFENGQSAKLPVEGTIPRGWAPYDYEDSFDGLDKARTELKNPLSVTQKNLAAGQRLYTIYCAVCHGDKGDGKGILAQREKFLGIPSYADPGRNITEGSIYHVQMYGLNSMGSYASQTSEKERWQITLHVENLMAELKGTPKKEVVEATSNNNTAETATEEN
jgi:mono/diheme cytochrome c family protein